MINNLQISTNMTQIYICILLGLQGSPDLRTILGEGWKSPSAVIGQVSLQGLESYTVRTLH